MPPLRSDPEFRKLWLGQSVSEIGSWVSSTALPLTAVLLLNATPAQMGILSALGTASALLFSLFAGVLVDRVRRRPILIGSDIARALLLSTIPIAAAFHLLTYAQILAVAAASGAVTVFFNVAYQSYLPSLIEQSDLFRGNRILGMSTAVAEVLGPLLAGILIKIISAPAAILLDALSYVVSAFSIAAIRRPEQVLKAVAHTHWREEALAGARAIQANPLLFALAMRSIMAYFFGGMMSTLYMLYVIRSLRMSMVALGVIIGLGGVGSFAGSYFAERISIRIVTARAFFFSALLTGLLNLLIPMSALFPSVAVWLLGTAQLFGDAAWSLYVTNELTLRQRITSAEVLGRVNAAMQIASQGMLPLGALAGGALASVVGIPSTLWISAVGFLASCLWLLMARNGGPEFATLQ